MSRAGRAFLLQTIGRSSKAPPWERTVRPDLRRDARGVLCLNPEGRGFAPERQSEIKAAERTGCGNEERVNDRNHHLKEWSTDSPERWVHITDEHCELAGMRLEVLEAIAEPACIYTGNEGELLAVREIEAGKFLVVVYRELPTDGFVITAFLTRRVKSLERRLRIWPLPN